MPWSETNRMEQRARFVLDVLARKFTLSELCFRYGVSRKTGYKWVERYERLGRSGCDDRSRSPKPHPNSTDPKLAYPHTAWPSPSTIVRSSSATN